MQGKAVDPNRRYTVFRKSKKMCSGVYVTPGDCVSFIQTQQLPAVRRQINNQKRTAMGDKSPKSVQKQASQKKAKANAATQKKQHAAAAKQVGGKK